MVEDGIVSLTWEYFLTAARVIKPMLSVVVNALAMQFPCIIKKDITDTNEGMNSC